MNATALYNKDDQVTYAIMHAMLQTSGLTITTAQLAEFTP